MKRLLTCLCCALGLLAIPLAFSQPMNPTAVRSQAQKLKTDGNFNEAYKLFRRLCLDPNVDANSVGQDLADAVQCLQQLGRIQEFDDLAEQTVAAHKQDWRLLQTAAQQYLQVEHQGFRVAGKF